MFITPETTPPATMSGGVKRGSLLIGACVAILLFVGLIAWLRSRGGDAPAPIVSPIVKTEQKKESPTRAPEAAPVFATDSDGDGVSDTDEAAHGTNPQKGDTDGDGSNDFEEIYTRKTNPLVVDPPIQHPLYAPSATP